MYLGALCFTEGDVVRALSWCVNDARNAIIRHGRSLERKARLDVFTNRLANACVERVVSAPVPYVLTPAGREAAARAGS